MDTGPIRRVVQCEEWNRIDVGEAGAPISFDEVGEIFKFWRMHTGTDPGAYFDFRGNKLIPRNWTGVAPGENVQIEVLPVGALGLSPSLRQVLDQNISLMLQTCFAGSSLDLGESNLGQYGQRVEVLLASMCGKLEKARRRQIIRQYTPARMRTRFPRGRIVFPRQVYEHIRRPGYFYSEWVSLDEDTAENRFIKAALVRSRPTASGSLRCIIDKLLCDLGSVTVPSAPAQEWRRIRFDRLSKDYIDVLKLAKSLIDDEMPGIFSGLTNASSEVVFTARVFEQFIGNEIGRIASSHGYMVEKQSRGKYLGKWTQGTFRGENVFEVIPDIQLRCYQESRLSCVIDTKWKRLYPNSRQFGVGIDDIYQILSYAIRFGHKQGVLVYPWVAKGTPVGDPLSVPMVVSGGNVSMRVYIAFVPMLEAGFVSLRERIEKLLDCLRAD